MTTRAAATCDSTDIQTQLDASAAAGDTVTVPAGSCTWTSGVSYSNKSIALIGAGRTLTHITLRVNSAIQTGTSDTSRVSALHLISESGTSWTNYINVRGPNFRADNNRFENQNGGTNTKVAVYFNADVGMAAPSGVCDTNIFDNTRVIQHGNLSLTGQMLLWNDASTITAPSTTTGVVYVETNTFTVASPTANNIVDANQGGRYVFRYNTIVNSTAEAHSVQGNHRGTKSWEVYNNVFTGTGAVPSHGMFLRGGTGIAFGNTFDTNYNSSPIKLDNVRSFTDYATPPDGCNNTSDWDGNTTNGWPCRDQIGRGPDSSLWTDTASPYSPAPPSQPSLPTYFFVNTRGGSQVNPSIANCTAAIKANGSCADIVEDRDYYDYDAAFNGTSGTGRGVIASRPATCTTGVAYQASDESDKIYKCTATNTWTAYWSPAAYPHALAGGTGCVASLSGSGVFPDTIVAASYDNSFTLTNVGDATCTINSITEDSGEFSIQSNTCGGTLAASANCTFAVRFTPTGTGAKTGTLTVDTSVNDPTTALSGTGISVADPGNRIAGPAIKY